MGTRTRSLEALGSEMTASGPAAWYVLCMCVFVFLAAFFVFVCGESQKYSVVVWRVNLRFYIYELASG